MDRVAIIIFKDEKYAYIRLSPKMLHKRRPVCNKRVTHSECFTIQTHPFEQLMHIPTPPPTSGGRVRAARRPTMCSKPRVAKPPAQHWRHGFDHGERCDLGFRVGLAVSRRRGTTPPLLPLAGPPLQSPLEWVRGER